MYHLSAQARPVTALGRGGQRTNAPSPAAGRDSARPSPSPEALAAERPGCRVNSPQVPAAPMEVPCLPRLCAAPSTVHTRYLCTLVRDMDACFPSPFQVRRPTTWAYCSSCSASCPSSCHLPSSALFQSILRRSPLLLSSEVQSISSPPFSDKCPGTGARGRFASASADAHRRPPTATRCCDRPRQGARRAAASASKGPIRPRGGPARRRLLASLPAAVGAEQHG